MEHYLFSLVFTVTQKNIYPFTNRTFYADSQEKQLFFFNQKSIYVQNMETREHKYCITYEYVHIDVKRICESYTNYILILYTL